MVGCVSWTVTFVLDLKEKVAKTTRFRRQDHKCTEYGNTDSVVLRERELGSDGGMQIPSKRGKFWEPVRSLRFTSSRSALATFWQSLGLTWCFVTKVEKYYAHRENSIRKCVSKKTDEILSSVTNDNKLAQRQNQFILNKFQEELAIESIIRARSLKVNRQHGPIRIIHSLSNH